MKESKNNGLAGLLDKAAKLKSSDTNPWRVLKIPLSAMGFYSYSQEEFERYLSHLNLSREEYERIFRAQIHRNGIETNIHRKNELTVGSWNVQYSNYERVVEVLQDGLGLDVIVINEFPIFLPSADRRDSLDFIAGKTPFTQIAYAPSSIFPNEKIDGFLEVGNVILSRLPISGERIIHLKQLHAWYKDKPYPRFGSRIALHVTIALNDLDKAEAYAPQGEVRGSTSGRVIQFTQLLNDADSTGIDKVVIAGDINQWAWHLTKKNYKTDKITQLATNRGYSDPLGESCICTLNYILARYVTSLTSMKFTNDRIFSKGFEVKSFRVMDNINITDHFPVKAVFGYK